MAQFGYCLAAALGFAAGALVMWCMIHDRLEAAENIDMLEDEEW